VGWYVPLLDADTHVQAPARYLLLGSVAEGMLRAADCPVLTLRNGLTE
jgi:hypothetical protein